ncbi:MAG: dethiobiotin synthase [Chitinophagales bacterium]|nr:dethiobiotin synthase [Chitinophagales bacterium]
MKGFFVTGIGTDIGKTVVSAVLVEALKADYWKPVQSGGLEYTDSDFVREHTLHPGNIHPEVYRFRTPVSPHLAAEIEEQVIAIEEIKPVNTNNYLIVEGAGGLMVPLTDGILIKDLIKVLQIPVIVVSKNYLGSINHTLLTLEALKHADISVAGIIFNGEPNQDSESYIQQYTRVPVLGRVEKADILSKGFIAQQAEKLRPALLKCLPPADADTPSTSLNIDYESI